MSNVFVVGAGMTPVGKFPDRSLRDITERAVSAAFADAAMDASDVDAVFFSNSVAGIVTGQECIRGQTALRGTGLMGKPMFNVENACASGSSAYFLARNAIESGMCRPCWWSGPRRWPTTIEQSPIARSRAHLISATARGMPTTRVRSS